MVCSSPIGNQFAEIFHGKWNMQTYFLFTIGILGQNCLTTKNGKSSSEKYPMNIRVVRFPITETKYEVLLTNLPDNITPMMLKELYNRRWGIETR